VCVCVCVMLISKEIFECTVMIT
jgi:hypothetical protein